MNKTLKPAAMIIRISILLLAETFSQLVFSQHTIPLPTPAQLQWQEAELAALISYDLHVFDGKEYVQQENRITPVADYNIFHPQNLDTDQWVKSLKDA
jgi:alpha-L-fucosidase